jgi:hypothetical protein
MTLSTILSPGLNVATDVSPSLPLARRLEARSAFAPAADIWAGLAVMRTHLPTGSPAATASAARWTKFYWTQHARCVALAIEQWNRLHPEGRPVRYWPATLLDPPREGTTRSRAWLASGNPVVLIGLAIGAAPPPPRYAARLPRSGRGKQRAAARRQHGQGVRL